LTGFRRNRGDPSSLYRTKGALQKYYRKKRSHSSSERSERFVRFEPNVRSERVRYFSERETNVQALKRL